MKKVVKEELAAMDAESDRCAVELSDARVDVLGYACWWPSWRWAMATTANLSSGCRRIPPGTAGRRR